MNDDQNEYRASDAGLLVGELFSGTLTVVEALERLRTRLLDLSARNRLLNYRHPKGRCIQIADEPNVNLAFHRLYMDGKGVPFKHVPEPAPDTFEGKRPEAKLHAARLGISTSFEFPPNPEGLNGQRLHGLQTLLYPADLERQLRKIASDAKTAVEETGTNMLFLIFGFLEFYDSDDSERPMLAPLLSLPVALIRGGIDRETRTYQYTVQHNGEDLAENHTLREKLRRDFMLAVPPFCEENPPETYFQHIEQAVKNKRRWKVRRQITLGMLSFGKLAIWADLDTKKNPALLDNRLIKSVFSGGTGDGDGELYAEDYRIDEQPEASQPLIYDADSSQHSAIIDVLAGKNLVINGPPGTGKSQTITNIIAAALVRGKKVLFVSEKLAALEVVRHRLNQAGLGHFCLELHSHKTQKKKFLEDIQTRIETRFPAPIQFQAKLAILQRQKTALARYAELMGSRVGNALGLTVNEIFWAAERRRQELGDLAAEVNAIGFPDASQWTHDDIEARRSSLAGLAGLYDAIGRFDAEHPWWGFRPDALAPTDDEAIARIVQQALAQARAADSAADEFVAYFGFQAQPDAASAGRIRGVLEQVPQIPAGAAPHLLETMFDSESDPGGERSHRLLSDVSAGVTKARTLFQSASCVLVDGKHPSGQDVADARARTTEQRLSSVLLAAELGEALDRIARFENAIDTFASVVSAGTLLYGPVGRPTIETFLSNCGKTSRFSVTPFSIRSVTSRAHAVLDITRALSEALSRVGAVAERRGLPFDSSPDAVAVLADPDGLPRLAKNTPINTEVLEEARRLAASPLADRPIADLEGLKSLLEAQVMAFAEALSRCRSAVERLGIAFDSTESGVTEGAVLAKIAAAVPAELLEYRRPTFGHARTAELVEKVRRALAADHESKTSLDKRFYLDALPTVGELKACVAVLRRRKGLFAFFDGEWRKARRLHTQLGKEKRNVSSQQRANELAELAAWIEAREIFVSDAELQACFGTLFRGLETDPEKISRLNDWYLASHAALMECPGLSDKIDLSGLLSARVSELAARDRTVQKDTKQLAEADSAIRGILGIDVTGFREARATGWEQGLDCLRQTVETLRLVSDFFGGRTTDKHLSPRNVLRLMEARVELDVVAPDLSLLLDGETILREAAGEELGQLVAPASGRWSEAIAALSAAALIIAETASQARLFAVEDAPLSTAETFAHAKAELDEAWAAVVPLPAWNRFEDWAGLLAAGQSQAVAAKEILELLSRYARPGVSAEQVFEAFAEQDEARAILDLFAQSEGVRRMLGNMFEGVDTDLHCLSQTHAWGRFVSSLDLPAAVRRQLLSADAREVLETARRLYGVIDAGCIGVRQALDGLTIYGSFSWEEWQKSVRSMPDCDLPSGITRRLETVASVPGSVLPWSKYLSIRQQCRHEGLADFVAALESARLPSAALAAAFELAVYQSIGRAVYQTFPELSRFNGTAHEQMRSDYQSLDAEIIALTGQDFASQIERRTRVPIGQRGATVGEYTDMHLLRREINKQRRHIPIRQLIKRAGRALQELKPCFMMGPLSVAQYLEQGTVQFDLVVMDEASQLRPEEALGAIARGAQLVVVGDRKQLPPTSFFDRMLDSGDGDEEDEAPAVISGMESILDICQQLFTPVRGLRWHYRSHHESLIAFSNHHFYKNLIVFPSPYAKSPGLGVKYRYVRNGSYQGRQNLCEAQRVIDAILEHMIKRPHESLGVVTLNQTQRELIEDLLDKKLKTFDEGASFMGRWETEEWPFFIKNLENVQGDERDVIFISTTFGKAPDTSKVRQNFGPISRPDGWRRLNVLFTRAKRRIELFTSMLPEDIIVDDKTPLGTKALRDYLDFAKRGVLVTTDEGEREPDSDFEVAVANVIIALGYEVKPQLGVAGFFIDMAVRNPDRPGEFLAGIECDGATYHSGCSVRDRDRIRQDILESLGWEGRIHRIWSTDWFYNPRREIERLRNFLEERRRLSLRDEEIGWEEEVEHEAGTGNAVTEDDIAGLGDVPSPTAGEEDLFVEVGDRVTYCFVDDPNEKHSVLIVDSPDNMEMGLVNEQTLLAQALLGLSPGDIGEMEVAGQRICHLKVLMVQRQENFLV